MKILQTPVRFYPATGGVEKYALDLSKKLVERGNQVKVLCANEPKSDINNINNIGVDRLNYLCKIAGTNLTISLPFKLLGEKFDIIHTYLPTPWAADWSVIIGKLMRKKVVVSYCNDITGTGFGGKIAKIYNNTFLKLTLRLADKIIIIGPNYLQASKYLGKYSSKIKYIPVGVNRQKFKSLNTKKQKNTLFFLSLLNESHKYKGLEYLLKAIKIAKNKIPDIKLVVGGKGELLDYYKTKSMKLNIQDNVEFHGYIPDNKLVEYYNKCELFILPSTDSTQEGFGLVALEALACGTPVITTEIVGVASEIKKHNAGTVVPAKNAEYLAKSIIEILQNESTAGQLAINSEKTARKFDLNDTTNQILKIYKGLVNS